MAGRNKQLAGWDGFTIDGLGQVSAFNPHGDGAVGGFKHDLRRDIIVIRGLDHIEQIFLARPDDLRNLGHRLFRNRCCDHVLSPHAFCGRVVGHDVRSEVAAQILGQRDEGFRLVIPGREDVGVELMLPAGADEGIDFLQSRPHIVAPFLRRRIPGREIFAGFAIYHISGR